MTGRPLDGVAVLDFTHGVAGPYATMILGDLGAEVIKIEMPGRGDVSRFMNISPRFERDIPVSGGDYYLTVNRNKKSVALNVATEAGRELALELSSTADVIAQSFRPGVLARLGLAYDDVRRINPGVIYASLAAYGRHGPNAEQPGMDVGIQARSGVMSVTGEEGQAPVRPGVSLADFSGGAHLAVAILGALVHRGVTGIGQELSVSLFDATMSMLSNYCVAVVDGGVDLEPMGSGHPQLVPYQAFQSTDGYVVIATGTNKLFRELCQILDLSILIDDDRFRTNPDRVRNRRELVPMLEARILTRATNDWLKRLGDAGIPCAPINDLRSAFTDHEMIDNGMLIALQHPTYGEIHVVGSPYKFGLTGDEHYEIPPRLGEHTAAILSERLGIEPAQLHKLAADGVIG